MKTNHKIHCAVAAILAASATAARAAEPTTGEAATETTGITEVIVTAQRRSGELPGRADHDSGADRRDAGSN